MVPEQDNFNHGNIEHLDISQEMKTSFLDYAMSVIVSRALPDVKDGLKPVHRRIIYAMNDLGMYADRPYKKSARIVGDVIGKYHPHGDTAVYDAMVRMAQEFSQRYLLVDGHGNFGSIDGDGPAAMRYTEAKMSKISMELVRDINKDTVDFVPNYDGEEQEPVVLPARFPNLLVNGATGIAVGMATNMAPHNLVEVIEAIIATIDNPDISIRELLEGYIYGPDFPTGGLIIGRSAIKQAFETGRGSIVCRAKAEITELGGGKEAIIITELPYQVNKATLIERIANLVREKDIEGITDLRDESNREGIKIVIELRRDVQSGVILNQLYRMTPLQVTFGVNNLALVDNAPKLLNLKQQIEYYIEHQITVVRRFTKYDLVKAEERAHILAGLKIALDHIDAILSLIRNSEDDRIAHQRLMEEYNLSEIQAKAILDMQFRRLTGLQQHRIEAEYNELLALIKDYQDILARPERVLALITTDLNEIKAKYGDKRRTAIIEGELDVEDEDLIPVEDIFITMTENGYIKRLTTDTYRLQNRGGRGVIGMSVHEDDIVEILLKMSTHDYLLLFTNFGKVYRIKGYQVPLASRTAKGIPVVNLLKLETNEHVQAMLSQNEAATKFLFFVTKYGVVKRVPIEEFDSIRQTGKIAIALNEGDELMSVRQTDGNNEIIIGASNGKAVRFHESAVRAMGRPARGVKGIELDGSEVVGVATDQAGQYILSITENGYGKKTPLSEYRLTNRGTKGVISISTTARNGKLIALRAVEGDEDLLIITTEGVVIRISLLEVAIYGRSTQGVKLINLKDETTVAAVTLLTNEEENNESNQEKPVNPLD